MIKYQTFLFYFASFSEIDKTIDSDENLIALMKFVDHTIKNTTIVLTKTEVLTFLKFK